MRPHAQDGGMPSGFLDLDFPMEIAAGATFGPGYSTTITEAGGGDEQRQRNWQEARLRFDVGPQLTSRTLVERFLAFWRIVGGRHRAFRFRDPSDFNAGHVLGPTGWTEGVPEPFGVGDGVRTTFRLRKRYQVGTFFVDREIRLPRAATVKVYVNGTLTAAAVNGTTGDVTFANPPASGAALAWSGAFDVPCRFDVDRPDIRFTGNVAASASVPIVEVRY